jgi:hypothetical protein
MYGYELLVDAEREGYKILSNGVIIGKLGKPMVPTVTHEGYHMLRFCVNGGQVYTGVHRLVAMKYVENVDGKPYVNHLDECPSNNHYTNLSWVTHTENVNYGTGTARRVMANGKAVMQLTKGGTPVKIWKSVSDAKRIGGFDQRHISDVCLGRRRTHGGFVWKYF